MEIQYSIVQNSQGGGLNALVMRAWYVDAEGMQITVKTDIKTGLTLDQCFDEAKAFVNANKGGE